MERKIFCSRNHVYGKNESKIVIILSMFLSTFMLYLFGATETNNKELLNANFTIVNRNSVWCKKLRNELVVDTLRMPFAFFLMLVLVVLHRRRSFCTDVWSWRIIGLPMITSLWKKSDRIYSAFVYCIIYLTKTSIFTFTLPVNKSQKLFNAP